MPVNHMSRSGSMAGDSGLPVLSLVLSVGAFAVLSCMLSPSGPVSVVIMVIQIVESTPFYPGI